MSDGYFDTVEHQLDGLCRRHAHRRRRLRRGTGWSRSRGGLAGVVAGTASIAVAVAVAVLALGLHHGHPLGLHHGVRGPAASGGQPSGGSLATLPPAQQRQAVKYVGPMVRSALNRAGPACAAARRAQRHPYAAAPGRPGRGLLARLAVLRRPAGRADRVPLREISTSPSHPYIAAVRYARTALHTRYYVVPELLWPGFTRACVTAEQARIRDEAAQVPAGVRHAVVAYALQATNAERQSQGAGIAAVANHGGFGFQGLTVRRLTSQPTATLAGLGVPVLFGLAPDGVASVRVRMTSGNARFSTLTLSKPVVHNVFVIATPVGMARVTVTSVAWLTAGGRTIRVSRGQQSAAGESYGYSSSAGVARPVGR